MKKTIILIIFFSCLISCMYVKNLTKNSENTTKEISLDLNRLGNIGGTDDDRFNSIIESGNYYIAVGQSLSDLSGLTGGSANQGAFDFVIAKFNKFDLSLVSINSFGEVNTEGLQDIIESGGYYIAVGWSTSDLSGMPGGSAGASFNDFVIARFNKADLSLDRITNFGGGSPEGLYSVIESDGYYIATGYSWSDLSTFTGGNPNQGNYDFVIVKFNATDLSFVCLNNLGGTESEEFYSVIESSDYYITVGYSRSDLPALTGGSNTTGGYDFVIAKFNKTNLSLVNINNLGGSSWEQLREVIESGDYYIAAGYSLSDLSGLTGGTTNLGVYDFVIARFNKSDLSLDRLKNQGGTSSDYFYSIIESGDYYVAAGASQSDLSAFEGGNSNQGVWDSVVAKIDKETFSIVEINNFGDTSDDILLKVAEAGNYYISAGYSNSDLSSCGGTNTQGNNDLFIARFGE